MVKKLTIIGLFIAYSIRPGMCEDWASIASSAMDAVREARMQNAASTEVKDIFAKAIDAEEDGNINFCGFYTGMSKTDAQTLADFYKLKSGEWYAKTLSSPSVVYELWFNLRSVRRLTKGGNSFDELAQAVANRIGTLKRKDVSGGKEWWEYTTIDDVGAIMSEHDVREAEIKLFFDNRSVDAGLTIFDKKCNARAERERAAREQLEEARRQKQVEDAAQHAVRDLAQTMIAISGKGYAICKYEVTQALWQSVMEENPSKFKGANRPVDSIRFSQIEEFLGKLNSLPEVQASEFRYRLPTTEEWEYACRAGSSGDYCKMANGDEITMTSVFDVAWCGWEPWEGGSTHVVGQKMPNAFGLYDMLGNVWEWSTGSKEGEESIGGGAYNQHVSECTSSARRCVSGVNCSTNSVRDNLGFRLAADKVNK